MILEKQRNRRRAMLWMIILSLITALVLTTNAQASAFENLKKSIPSKGLKVYFIQLTSGEATLIQLENGQNVLIDTGSAYSKEELFYFLNEHDVQVIHHLIITNKQDEHFGNFSDVYEQYYPKELYFPFYEENYFTKLQLDEDVMFHPLVSGDTITFYDDCQLKVLHPDESLSLSTKDNSLVFQLVHGEQKLLFTSDISAHVEKHIMEEYELRSHVLKVSDFGSRLSSSEAFLSEVDAHVAVIFYRSEHYLEPEVLERLQESWMDVYPVKKHGHILVVSEKEDYKVFVVPSEKDSDLPSRMKKEETLSPNQN